MLVKNYGEWYGLPYAITYFYNVYGEGEIAGGPYATLVAIFKEKYKHGQPLTVVSPGTQSRNFTHIDDTVDGLLLVGAKGQGDNYGIGSAQTFSVLDVANMFGGEILMMPERRGNRMQAPVDSAKVTELGWKQKHTLAHHIAEYKKTHDAAPKVEKRVLVFSTTFAPVGAAAEKGLGDVITAMPEVHFDIITTKFTPGTQAIEHPLPNVTLYRVGKGAVSDKYQLPFEGTRIARKLMSEHSYLFMWSILASYGALAAARSRSAQKNLPLLITLADQEFPGTFSLKRLPLSFALGSADQISTTSNKQELGVSRVAPSARLSLSNRSGDAFANQVRFLYNMMLKKYL
jgi:hypothetical protein